MPEYSPRELVFRSLRFEPTPRVPRQLWVLPWAECHYPDELAEIRRDFPDDIVSPPVDYPRLPHMRGDFHTPGMYVDEWGCAFTNIHHGIIGEVKNPLITSYESDLDKVRPPDSWIGVVDGVNEACGQTDCFMLSLPGVNPFERMQWIRGPENLLMDLMEQPPGFFQLRDRVHRWNLAMIDSWAQTDVDAIGWSDDWGTQRATLISPALWRELFKPLYLDYIERIHAAGKFAFMHSDGHIFEIYEDLIELGVDAINTANSSAWISTRSDGASRAASASGERSTDSTSCPTDPRTPCATRSAVWRGLCTTVAAVSSHSASSAPAPNPRTCVPSSVNGTASVRKELREPGRRIPVPAKPFPVEDAQLPVLFSKEMGVSLSIHKLSLLSCGGEKTMLNATILIVACAATSLAAADQPTWPKNIQVVLDETAPLKWSRGKRLPLYLWPAHASGALDENTARRMIQALDECGIGLVSRWHPSKREQSLADALRIARIQTRLGLRVNVNANACVYSFFNGDERTAHIDDAGKPFWDDSFGNKKMGCPFALDFRRSPIREQVEHFVRAYKQAGVRLDFVFADWEIDGPIEFNRAHAFSKKCKRCRKHLPDIDDFVAFQKTLRDIRSDLLDPVAVPQVPGRELRRLPAQWPALLVRLLRVLRRGSTLHTRPACQVPQVVR